MKRRAYVSVLSAAIVTGFAGCTSTEEQEIGTWTTDTEGTAAGTDGQDPDQTTDEAADETTEDETPSDGEDETSAEATAAIGEVIDGETMQLVVESFDRGVDLGSFDEPDPGNEFAVVALALKNTSAEYTTVSNLLQTRIRDDEGYQYDQTFASGDAPTFNDGQFAPGEVERGIVPFEIPTDASGLELVFTFDVATFGRLERAIVDLDAVSDDPHQLVQELELPINAVGDTVEYGDVQVAVNEFRTESSLGQFTEPAEGNEYAVVDLSITNGTGEQQRFSTGLQMMLKDGEGYTYQEDYSATSQLDRAFDEATPLADGETRRGQLAYEVEQDLSPLYWVFEFSLFSTGDKTFWELQ